MFLRMGRRPTIRHDTADTKERRLLPCHLGQPVLKLRCRFILAVCAVPTTSSETRKNLSVGGYGKSVA